MLNFTDSNPITNAQALKQLDILQNICPTLYNEEALGDGASTKFQELLNCMQTAPVSTILKEVDFNAEFVEGSEDSWVFSPGCTLLAYITERAKAEVGETKFRDLLKIIFERLPLEELNFNAASTASYSKGETVLHAIADMGVDDSYFILKLLNSLDLNFLNFNAWHEITGETPFTIISRDGLDEVEPLLCLLDKAEPGMLDFNVQYPSLHGGDNKTPLWNIALASLKNPKILELVVNKFSSELDFQKRANVSNFSDVTLQDWISTTPLKSIFNKIQFNQALLQANNLYEDLNQNLIEGAYECKRLEAFQNHLCQLEKYAEQANQDGYYGAYHEVANFYNDSGLTKHLKALAENIPTTNPYHDAVYSLLAHAKAYSLPNTMQWDEAALKPNRQKHKRKLLKAFEYSLETKDTELQKNMAFNYSYDSSLGQKKGLPSQSNEPLLEDLGDTKKTYVNAIITLRKKLRLEREIEEKDVKIAQQAKEIEELKQKLLHSTPN